MALKHLFPVLAALLACAEVRAAEADLGPLVAREVAPRVHLLSTPADYRGAVIGNITVVEQRDGVVVIDSGGTAADGRRVVSFVRSLGPKPVKAVAITHWHHDHPLGVSAIREAWPRVRIVATPQTREAMMGTALNYVGVKPSGYWDAEMLNQQASGLAFARTEARNPAHDEALRARYARMAGQIEARMRDVAGTHMVAPTQTFTGELLLDDPDAPVRLLYLGRANTEGDAIAWLPKQRIVVTGDVVVAPTPFGFFSFPKDWIEVLGRIKAMNYALLIPGHGETQTDAAYLDRLVDTLTDLRSQVGGLVAQGLTLEQVKAKVDFAGQMKLFGDTPRNRSMFEANWLKPMTVNAYREAAGLPMVQGDEALYR